MKTHRFLNDGCVKLNTPFYMDRNLLTDDKWIQKENGDYDIYLFDEPQQQIMANFLIGRINDLIENNIDKLVKQAKEYVGQGNILK
jgi:hypothetical protein